MEAGSLSGYTKRMDSIASHLAGWLIRWRVVVLVITALLTLIAGFFALRLEMDPGFDKSIPLAHEYMRTYSDYSETFGGANTVLIALQKKSGDIFDSNFFHTLQGATEDVMFMTGVTPATVTSLFTPNVSFVAINEEGFTGGRVISSEFKGTPDEIQTVRSNLLKSGEIGRTVSRDLSGALIIAQLVEHDPVTGERIDYRRVASELEAIRAKYQSDEIDLHIIGFSKFIGDVIQGASDVLFFFLIATVITA
ncbi:MAG: multidrug RND transporter, partial [Gammaproteobacteria bacterium]|nr:multidrug RND transporter [Gammaproteobacteria bacterium]